MNKMPIEEIENNLRIESYGEIFLTKGYASGKVDDLYFTLEPAHNLRGLGFEVGFYPDQVSFPVEGLISEPFYTRRIVTLDVYPFNRHYRMSLKTSELLNSYPTVSRGVNNYLEEIPLHWMHRSLEGMELLRRAHNSIITMTSEGYLDRISQQLDDQWKKWVSSRPQKLQDMLMPSRSELIPLLTPS